MNLYIRSPFASAATAPSRMMKLLQPRQVRQGKTLWALSRLVVGLVAASLAMGCVPSEPQPLASVAPTERAPLDATAAASFSQQIGRIDDINHALTLERAGVLDIRGFPSPSPNDIFILVLNHAAEPIRFADTGFELTVFQFDARANEWQRVRLPHPPGKTAKTIPAGLEAFDSSVFNVWNISHDELSGVTSDRIRIFMSGTGVQSHRRYGAFLEVQLQRGQIQSKAGIGF